MLPHSIALYREWRRRIATIEQYDRDIARSSGDLPLQELWSDLKRQELDDARWLKAWLDRETDPRG